MKNFTEMLRRIHKFLSNHKHIQAQKACNLLHGAIMMRKLCTFLDIEGKRLLLKKIGKNYGTLISVLTDTPQEKLKDCRCVIQIPYKPNRQGVL